MTPSLRDHERRPKPAPAPAPGRAGRRGAARRGATSVELAVLLPFLAFLFVLAIDYARVFYYAQIVENCARNGAYYAANYSPQTYAYPDTTAAAMEDAGADLKPAPAVTVRYSATPDGPYTSPTPIARGYVEVTVTWTFRTITNFPGIDATVNLTRSARMEMAPNLPTFP